MNTKNWFVSKTIWVNILAILGIVIQAYTGFIVTPELQTAALGVINVALRFITKDAIDWKKHDDNSPTGGNAEDKS